MHIVLYMYVMSPSLSFIVNPYLNTPQPTSGMHHQPTPTAAGGGLPNNPSLPGMVMPSDIKPTHSNPYGPIPGLVHVHMYLFM